MGGMLCASLVFLPAYSSSETFFFFCLLEHVDVAMQVVHKLSNLVME